MNGLATRPTVSGQWGLGYPEAPRALKVLRSRSQFLNYRLEFQNCLGVRISGSIDEGIEFVAAFSKTIDLLVTLWRIHEIVPLLRIATLFFQEPLDKFRRVLRIHVFLPLTPSFGDV